ncbi:hypothetical protein GCM10025865_27570 [Paraoerskovia sediminicola]|uniref:DUF3467 domain-containing protein n=1 Tax=Paraoerskovia sediminicola TaxID=1138587 RepID=A0ABN6XH94_9CELL|nr:DUF3467 domain-containing protein [Paraoerskovia sediminicola]BDZ43458.1 hypothetical protein GCM10025865_27570 [Paraoerskovia sediminicola]
MAQDQARPRRNFQIELPSENEAGVPADFASIWHTPSSFVLDFVAMKSPAVPKEDKETGERVMTTPVKVVSRVRIPPDQVFEIASALTKQLDAWEKERAQIAAAREPRRPDGPAGTTDPDGSHDPSDPTNHGS